MPKLAAAKNAVDAAKIYLFRWRERGVSSDWMIMAEPRQAGEEYVLRSTWSAGYQNAWIYVNTDAEVVKRGGQQLSYMMLHELIHLAHAPMENIVDSEFHHDGTLHRQFVLAAETVTDKLTAMIWRAYEGDNLF